MAVLGDTLLLAARRLRLRGQRRFAVLAVIGAFVGSALLTVATCSGSQERDDRAAVTLRDAS